MSHTFFEGNPIESRSFEGLNAMNARAATVNMRTTMSDCLHKYLGLNERRVKSRSCIVADTVTRWRKATFETLCNSGGVDKVVRNPHRASMNGQHNMDTGGIEVPFRSQQRISKIIALREFCSRREAERLISRSQVVVNGVLIHQGSKAEFDSEIQLAEIDDQVWFQSKSTVALNKPRGYASNLPSQGEVEACSFSSPQQVHILIVLSGQVELRMIMVD